MNSNADISALYVREPQRKWLNIERVGDHRQKFENQCIDDLRSSLQARGIELSVETGNPLVIVANYARDLNVEHVHFGTLPAFEEQQTEAQLTTKLNADTIKSKLYRTYTLWSYAEVRERMNKPLRSFSQFRKVFEPLLKQFPPRALANDTFELSGNPLGVFSFIGGRSAALIHIHEYLAGNGAIRHYKETRNGLLGKEYSSKLSPWLSWGCLGVDEVIQAIHQHEVLFGENESTHWLKIELLWREFFQHLARQLGAQLFTGRVAEINFESIHTRLHASFSAWAAGETGQDFVDANMRELNATGYMSNRGRQNVASALIYDMRDDWRKGACYFERQLIDYDPASNYGNWQYIAGIHANPRGGSWFNLEKQANMYDNDARYRTYWLNSEA